MDYLYQFEGEYHGNTILNGIKHFEEISVNLTITYSVLRRLTYHPELIRLALDYIRQNKDEILHKEARCAHPILHELLHQSEILYHEKRLLNDERFDVARDNLEYFIKELQTDSFPVNFLKPLPGTALEHLDLMDVTEALRTIALLRLVNPKLDMFVCGGREEVFGEEQEKVFAAGANGILGGDYLTTKGQDPKRDIEMIERLGLVPILESQS